MQPDTIIHERYRILRLLGSGGMGSVYAAYDERLHREVALKLLRPDLAVDATDRTRFLREAQIAAQLLHPNIVRIYDVGESADGAYLVQELLDGQTLDQLIPLPPKRALSIAIAVAEALEYIHARGYVHCDVKPENIMLVTEPDGERVVLLDFGIARAQDAHTTALIATPQYIAPERAQGAAATPASDLYALGVMLYYMLSGRLPFDGPSVHAVLDAHLHAALPPLDIDAPNAPMLAAIVTKLTAKQPGARYSSVAALLLDLRAAREGKFRAHLLPRKEPRIHVPEPPRTDRRAWALPLLPLLAICLILAITWSRGSGSDSAVPTNAFRSVQAIEMPDAITVPDVIGMPLNEAIGTLEQAGLEGVAGNPIPSDKPAGAVAATVPGPGEPIESGVQVVVQPSAAPASAVPTPSPAVPTATPAQQATPTSSPTMGTVLPTATLAAPTATPVEATPTQVDPAPTPLAPTAPPSNDEEDEEQGNGDDEEGDDEQGNQGKKNREKKSKKSN